MRSVIEVGSSVMLALTLGAVWWQARATAKQAEVASATAGASEVRTAMMHLQTVLAIWLERPELRTYFDAPLPWPNDTEECSRLRTTAEMWADCVASSLSATENVEAFKPNASAWHSYASVTLSSSVVLYSVITEHREWWPEFTEILAQIEPPQAAANTAAKAIPTREPEELEKPPVHEQVS